MTSRNLSASATGCTGIISIEVNEAYSTLSSNAVIECNSSTLSLGSTVNITMGYEGDTAAFNGYLVKKITRLRPENTYRIDCNDVLVRAIDYFMAADDPEAPFQRNNISSLNLVRDLLSEAGITNVTSVEPGPAVFTWGTNEDGARFNLQSVADAIQFIAQITGNTIYFDRSADLVQFVARKPYVDGDSPIGTLNSGDELMSIEYMQSNGKTRNVIQVYGKGDIRARARADSPYLVVDQAVVIAHELIDTSSMAQGTADINLTILNRLEESYQIEIEGKTSLAARQVWSVQDSVIQPSARDVFLYAVTHSFSQEGGYRQTITGTP